MENRDPLPSGSVMYKLCGLLSFISWAPHPVTLLSLDVLFFCPSASVLSDGLYLEALWSLANSHLHDWHLNSQVSMTLTDHTNKPLTLCIVTLATP